MSNDEMRGTWTDNAAGWVAHEAIFDGVFAPVTSALLTAAGPARGERALDVGCGSGTLLAAVVEAGAEAVGVDISVGMAQAARTRVPAATVLVEDAQGADLLAAAPGRAFDLVVSRFGVMFFGDPLAAFANLRQATAPAGRLVFACWQDRGSNPIFTLGSDVLAERMDPPPPVADPRAPGPTALADPARVRQILTGAGWSSVDVAPLEFACDHGFDGSDGVENRMATILGTTTGRLAREQLEPALGAAGWSALLDDVRRELRRHLVGNRLSFPANVWIVSATNPG